MFKLVYTHFVIVVEKSYDPFFVLFLIKYYILGFDLVGKGNN